MQLFGWRYTAIATIGVAVWAYRLYHFLGFQVQLDFNDQHCFVVDGSTKFAGSEDLQMWNGGSTVVVTAGDLHSLMRDGVGGPTQTGAIYTVDLAAPAPTAKELPISGFPLGLAFQPHGFHISKDLVYVINHPGASGGGSRVEVFRAVEEEG